ncbi:putative metal-dependent enzyme (double-stranded beta helix superfamily) [Amycolatopsis cihanbeyliensis]|uniref:Putative metal-dependent enzyme (Double-stranded beta helix superfamily) n=2 Tax=Amycolatopsis cihanbeyliensis TaxID=1128664 RepID=A0A542CT20_AMYCI|nr:putative metal-dependent enzyme (double-stranded beta helix superfamily) [Amycolatopsis cihanbeyliensis]
MTEFVARLSGLFDRIDDPHDRARAAAGALSGLLDADGVLAPEHTEPDPLRYRQHLVHVDGRRRFSVVSLVWLPGQRTPVHSHACWCVVGVVTGREAETRYRLDPTGRVEPAGTAVNLPGDVCWLVPPERDIHRVCNDGDRPAVSLHVYGTDIAARGSSINQVYAEPAAPPRSPEHAP